MTAFRLPRGGRIDRLRPLAFTFDGRRYQGFAGDTLASALLANDVLLVGRSLKYHRPRGILSAGAEEPSAIVQLADGPCAEPNLRATQIELFDGLVARPVNAWPSLRCDIGSLAELAAPLLAAGFYYKTFKWPRRFWRRIYEPAIRHMAGLGAAPRAPDPDTYDKMHAHCDVLVVGAGPAGLAAALAAGRSGARVILADEQAEPGGSLLARQEGPPTGWASAAIAELASLPEVTVLPRTTAFGYYDQNYLMLLERRTDHLGPGARPGLARQRLWHVRAREVVLATGAHERPLVFPGNDRPGVMLASAAAIYAQRYAVACGRRAVLFTNNDGAYRAALDLAAAGVEVAAIVDMRPTAAGELPVLARHRGITALTASAIVGVSGRMRVGGVAVRPLGGGPLRHVDCDLVLMSGGWNPAVHLFSQSQGRLRWDERSASFVPGTAAQQAQRSVGAANGTFGLGACLAEGAAAGLAAARATGFATGPIALPPVDVEDEAPLQPFWAVPPEIAGRGKAFVDFQSDVTAADIGLAAREGFTSIEHLKRYTTAGMATDQGKTANVNALAILSEITGRPIAEIGTTTFRPPYTPVAYGALAGREVGALFDPVRVTPMHRCHVAAEAVFENVGQWKRPWYYPQPGEDMQAAVRREAKAVRDGAGMMDVSTLGKIELRGPDAARFLDRIYTNRFSRLDIGRCRYGMMCRDDGMVFDDGVATRLAADRFFLTTTTGGAAAVLDWLEEWLQTEWPDLEVYLTSVTEQWAAVAIAGPHARALLQELAPGIALDGDAFPHLAMREGEVAGLAARIFRISFSGERAYEVYVPSHHGEALWEAVMRAGAKHGITPYGTEAMHLLRAEKGYIIVGQESDGTVTPRDLGMEWILARDKDFLGKRSLARPDTMRADRKQLVGLLPEDVNFVLPEGAQLLAAPRTRPPISMLGHVTSSYWSPNLGRSFALALVKAGRGRFGERLYAPLERQVVPVQVVEPVFIDKEGARLDG